MNNYQFKTANDIKVGDKVLYETPNGHRVIVKIIYLLDHKSFMATMENGEILAGYNFNIAQIIESETN